jgi:hypothetical protein
MVSVSPDVDREGVHLRRDAQFALYEQPALLSLRVLIPHK